MDAQAFFFFLSSTSPFRKAVGATEYKKEMLTFLDHLSLQNCSLGITPQAIWGRNLSWI